MTPPATIPPADATTTPLGASSRSLLFTGARSNTVFADRAVDPAVVAEAYSLARWAPTANNCSPLRLVLASSENARAHVIAHAHEANRPKLERAPLLVVVARDDRYHDLLPVTSPGAERARERLELDPEGRARRAHDNTMLGLGYLILALRGLGLAVRPYGGIDREALDAHVLEDNTWHAEVVLGIGYPAPEHGAGDRKARPEWMDAARVI